MLILQIAAGVILGGIGLHALHWLKDWWAVKKFRRGIIRVPPKRP